MVEEVFKERINELFREQQMSATAMAREAGISPASMNFYLAGDRRPDIGALYKICSRFGCSADWLLGLTNVRSQSMEVRTVAIGLGIPESFISRIQQMDNDSRTYFFKLLNTNGIIDEILPEYEAYKRLEDELISKKITSKDEKINQAEDVLLNGKVLLSHTEAVKYYAEKVGKCLSTLLLRASGMRKVVK